jgi:hypothetical protein
MHMLWHVPRHCWLLTIIISLWLWRRSLSLESTLHLVILHLARWLRRVSCLINFFKTYVLINLLRQLDSSHLIDRDCTLAIDPLSLDDMLLLETHNSMNTTDVIVGNKPKSSWLLCSLILKNNTVFKIPILAKVRSELWKCQVVRKTSDEDLTVLRIFQIDVSIFVSVLIPLIRLLVLGFIVLGVMPLRMIIMPSVHVGILVFLLLV